VNDKGWVTFAGKGEGICDLCDLRIRPGQYVFRWQDGTVQHFECAKSKAIEQTCKHLEAFKEERKREPLCKESDRWNG